MTGDALFEAIIHALQQPALAAQIKATPFGRLEITWQDNRVMMAEVTAKHKLN